MYWKKNKLYVVDDGRYLFKTYESHLGDDTVYTVKRFRKFLFGLIHIPVKFDKPRDPHFKTEFITYEYPDVDKFIYEQVNKEFSHFL